MAPHLGREKSTLAMSSSTGQTSFSHIGSTSGDPHSVDKLWGKDHWDMDNLQERYACKSGNPCMDSYRTPYEALTAHQWTCGSDYFIVSHRAPGCGEKYYKCPNHGIPDSHNTFKCNRYNLVVKAGESGRVREYCGINFRYCTKFTYDSYGNITTITSAGRCSKLLGVGQSGSHNHGISEDPDTSPGRHRHSEETETTIPYACGDHSGVRRAASGHVAAGCGNPNHFICDLGNHAPTSCGLLDHFNCDSLTHVEEQCTITNSNGERCTYMFWRCGNLTHTHTYPTPPPPPPPSATCANGHSYNPDNRPENNQHRTRTCRHCSQTWEVCGTGKPLCNKPNRKQNGWKCRE